MPPIDLSPATIIVFLLLVVGVVYAVRRLVKRGTCDCHGHKTDTLKPGDCIGCVGCAGCGAVEQIIASMEREDKKQ